MLCSHQHHLLLLIMTFYANEHFEILPENIFLWSILSISLQKPRTKATYFLFIRILCFFYLFLSPWESAFHLLLTFPQFIYSTAVSRNKKYTKSPWVKELTKFGAVNRRKIIMYKIWNKCVIFIEKADNGDESENKTLFYG